MDLAALKQKIIKQNQPIVIRTNYSRAQLQELLQPWGLQAEPVILNGEDNGFEISYHPQIHLVPLNFSRSDSLDHSQCGFSTGIDGSITCGQGELDNNGFWEIPCEKCLQRQTNQEKKFSEKLLKEVRGKKLRLL